MKKSIKVLGLMFLLIFTNNVTAQDAYLGDIKLTAVNFVQRGWMECDGSLLPIAQYSALFSLLGTQYGGDGRTTFALPDLRGRVPIGQGNGTGLPYYAQGGKGGSTENTLTVSNLPPHNHTVNAVVEDGNQSVPTDNLPASTKVLDKEYSDASTANTQMNASMINNTGGNEPVNNMQPYVTLRYVICVQGIFPSRN